MNNGAQNNFLLNQNDKSRKNVEKNFDEGKKTKIYINSSDIGFMHESIFFYTVHRKYSIEWKCHVYPFAK